MPHGQRRRDLPNERVIHVCQRHRQANPNGWVKASAAELGVHPTAIISRLKTAGLYASFQNLPVPAPAIPDGHTVRAVSTLVDEDGKTKLQWLKTTAADVDIAVLKRAIHEEFSGVLRTARIAKPTRVNADLMACYPIGDAHFGMHAWGEEAGDDFDLKIAETDLVNAVRQLIEVVPPCGECLLINVGDFYHADDATNRTPQSGHALDVDSRHYKVVKVGLRALRACIDVALSRHERVKVINRPGNHDPTASMILTVALAMAYEKNPRVSFEESPAQFVYHVFGKNLIGVTHGDTVKPEQLPLLMAAEAPEDWGRTTFRHWFTGHVHHKRMYELPGCTIESVRTLAAKDAWHAMHGYRSGRDMQAVIYDRNWGEIERHRMDISLLRTLR